MALTVYHKVHKGNTVFWAVINGCICILPIRQVADGLRCGAIRLA